MTKLAAPKKIVAPAVPCVKPPPPFVPAWAKCDGGWVHYEINRPARWVTMVMGGQLRIPRFQRAWKWTDAQILMLLDSIFRGDHVGSFLVWEQYNRPASTETFGEVTVESPAGRCSYVIDGQQRLSALVTAMQSGRFFLNLEDGTFSNESGAWRLPLGMSSSYGQFNVAEAWISAQHTEHGIDKKRLWECYAAAVDKMGNGHIGATVLPYAWTIDRVVETFERINSTGTPFEPEELRLALSRSEEA
jgi:hypothetical protein